MNLMKAKEEIISRHTGIGESLQVTADLGIMNMIKRLVSLSKDKAGEEALLLTKRNLEVIVKYLPHNYYKVQMDNLFLIYRLRCNLKLGWLLFFEWQNAYDNYECNEFLKTFVEESSDFEEIMNLNHFTIQKFRDIISSDNIPIAYGKAAVALKDLQLKKLKEKLGYLGIRESSRLSEDCNALFYVFCTEKDYLEIREKEVLVFVEKCDDIIRKKFLENFLEKLSLLYLKKFNRIAEYFIQITGENYSKKFNSYIGFLDSVLIRKYADWINIYKINKIFGDDERSAFWDKYHYKQVTKYIYSDSVVMEFERYIAVEFLGRSMGPLYIYEKEYFEKYVRKVFKTRRYDNMELRSYLLNQTDYLKNAEKLDKIKGIRLVHLPNPGWQSKFHGVLVKNHITERIL